MTSNTEQRQAIWQESGLAEVIFGPVPREQAEDAAVGFGRYRRTTTPGPVQAWPRLLGHADRRRLDQWGYVVLNDVDNLAAAEELVRSVGELIPQYNGHLTHDVIYRPGNDDRSYSQSANTILAHTEAPGWHPSPAYLALFCHRQARCGGGHTDLLDAGVGRGPRCRRVALMTEAELHLPGAGRRRSERDAEHRPPAAIPSQRFSYNLLTDGRLRPIAGRRVESSSCRSARPVAGWRTRQRRVPRADAPAC